MLRDMGIGEILGEVVNVFVMDCGRAVNSVRQVEACRCYY